MDERFVSYYEEELRFLRDMAGEFAEDNKRTASYLGLDVFPCEDPYVERLLEGFAFLAARVRLRQDTSFHRFTNHLLEIVYPGYLTPTPAILIAQIEPDLTAGSLVEGDVVPRDTRLNAAAAPGRSTRCIFQTKHDVTLWPIRLVEATYLSGPSLKAAGVPVNGPWQYEEDGHDVQAALRLTLETANELGFDQLKLDQLEIHFAGDDRVAHGLYQAVIGNGIGLVVKPAGKSSDDCHRTGADRIGRVGFRDDEALFPTRNNAFRGYRLLAEYFASLRRFMFARLSGLAPGITRCQSNRIDIFVLFNRVDGELHRTVTASDIALFATPAVNLFRRSARAQKRPGEHAHRVVVDPQRELDFEIYDVDVVSGYRADYKTPLVFHPFYSRSAFRDKPDGYYTVERRARLPSTSDGRRKLEKQRSSYRGGDVFLSLVDYHDQPFDKQVERLELNALCTNRDLSLDLVFEEGGNHFTHETGKPIARIRSLGEPTEPRPSIAYGASKNVGVPSDDHRDVPWRLISHLSPNYLSLADIVEPFREDTDLNEFRREGDGAATLREILRLYANPAAPDLLRQVDGVHAIRATPIVDRLSGQGPITFGRGLEIDITFTDEAFQGASAFLLGAVLEQFFRHFVSINAFVKCVVRTEERGVIKQWSARTGRRQVI